MSLDVMVRCTCFERRRTKPHPFPRLVRYSKVYGPYLTSSATPEQIEEHDDWYERSCPHHGYVEGAFLGNIWRVQHVREEATRVARASRRRFPILLRKVVYDGTHTGDSIPARQVPALLKEIRELRRLTKNKSTHDFLHTLARVCQASLRTGNPLQF